MNSTSPSLLFRLRSATDAVAWNRFIDLYTPLLMHWCRRLGMPDPDAADFTQEVIVLVLQQMPRFEYDGGRSFRAWLKTVLMNVWRKHQRTLARHPMKHVDADLFPKTDPVLFVDEAEHRDYLVRRAITIMQSDFEPITWKACQEFVMKGRPAEEVAAELGISVNAVYLAKSRVLRHLRAELAGLAD